MQTFLQSPLPLLIVVGIVLFFYVRNAKRAGGGFDGSTLLSGFATLVFAWFMIIGLLLFFSNMPTNALFSDLQQGAVRAIGAVLVLFGMFGLLIARGFAVLVHIERMMHTALVAPDTEEIGQAKEAAAYKRRKGSNSPKGGNL